MKYFIKTFGCQMNQHDSEFVGALLEKLEYKATDNVDEADVVVVNTCSIRDSAEKKIVGFIDRMIRRKKLNPNLKLAVIGCMASQQESIDALLKKSSHIDIVLGTRSLDRLPYYLEKLDNEAGPFVEFNLNENLPEGRQHQRMDKYRGYLTIMYGCDNYCSYCIVPYVRGREKSRELTDIVNEAQVMVADGVKEITLLGQNVNSYGKGLTNKTSFGEVLLALQNIEGLERIRYMTSHPKDFSDETIEAILASPKVCQHFHLPIQSGSSKILKKMNRHYTKEYYLELAMKIKAKFPDAVLTTDIIVGFPGETDEDFADTISLLENLEFDLVYSFIYSPRSGTPGAEMAEQITESIKKERLLTLMDVQNKISLEKNKSMIGKVYTLMGEGCSKKRTEVQSGRTEGNKIINFIANQDYTGKLINIEVTEANTWSLKGQLL